MRLVAGIDVGNATTEVVIVDVAARPPRPIVWDRCPTRGQKGSLRAAQAAAGLTARLVARHELVLASAVMVPQQPVLVGSGVVMQPPPATGRLAVVSVAGPTPGRPGIGVGIPKTWSTAITFLSRGGQSAELASHQAGMQWVLLVPKDIGYLATVHTVIALLARGIQLSALLLEADEGVLVSARLPAPTTFPVLDQVDIASAAVAERLIVEVPPAGHPPRFVADPVYVISAFQLGPDERSDAAIVASWLAAGTAAVVARTVETRSVASAMENPSPVSDPKPLDVQPSVWQVDLESVASSVLVDRPLGTARTVLSATLGPGTATASAAELAGAVSQVLGVPVRIVETEARAARAAALTTPGAAPNTWVVDLGGGTVDLIAPGGSGVVLAGAGQLLTAAVATVLELPRAGAEWVKRGPCERVETPHVLSSEAGNRRFAAAALPGDAVGRLIVDGPAGALPFGGGWTPSQWRTMRLRLKQRVLADNLARGIALVDGGVAGDPPDLLLVGGPAHDEELLGVLGRSLTQTVLGRANVAGILGPRYAVAFGAVLLGCANGELDVDIEGT